MKRLIITTVIAIAVSTASFPEPSASELRQADSQWSDYYYVKWRGGTSGYLTTTTNNTLDTSDEGTYCNRMSWSGTTTLFVKEATSTTLTDLWGVNSTGDATITGPDGVRRISTYNKAGWETSVLGKIQSHTYDDVPVTITADQSIRSINHTVRSARRIGRRHYDGPTFMRYESVCMDTP